MTIKRVDEINENTFQNAQALLDELVNRQLATMRLSRYGELVITFTDGSVMEVDLTCVTVVGDKS